MNMVNGLMCFGYYTDFSKNKVEIGLVLMVYVYFVLMV